MPSRAPRPCTTPSCSGTPVQGSAKCAECGDRARRPRPSATAQGYGREHRERFSDGVLTRDPTCVCPETAHGHALPCGAPSEHADHWPRSKRELRELDWDEHNPAYGRGLCRPCHSKETARHQPAGWNDVPPF
ncbi:holin [Streptomyces liliifuscus]|uniref:Holin n=1 Tax=Streptomyces liliifuscus TaxID=2797636 RepID=A0A7T7L283_9ACTN|nr:holin [Streptomyces liliifuscus]